jgi:hypothetical protein
MKPVVLHAPRHAHRSQLTLDKYLEEELPATPPPTPPVVIPPKEIFSGASTKTLSGFRDIRKEIKIRKLLDEFVTETGRILEYFSATEDKYNADVVHWVCDLAEHYFTQYKKMGAVKEQAVVECVSKFYNDDIQLVKTIIQLVLSRIKKSNILRRTRSRFIRAFFLTTIMLSKK